MHTQDVVLDGPGERLLSCQTTTHYDGGMVAVLDVAPSGVSDALGRAAPLLVPKLLRDFPS
jgi:hypothetical protein